MRYFAVIIFISFAIALQSNDDLVLTKFKGHVIDSVTNNGQLFIGVKLYANDTLWGWSITNLDGLFVVVCMKEIDINDKLILEFHSPEGIFEERTLAPFTHEYLNVFYKMNDSISIKELHRWKDRFKSSMPNYLDCHPYGPLDEFVVKKH